MIWDFQFNLPTRIEFGNGKIKELGRCIRELGGTKALVVTDQGIVKSGILKTVTEMLEANAVAYAVFDQVKPNPRDVDCMEAYRIAREAGVDVLIGLGGGSSMDTAKAVGTLLTHGGQISDWYGLNVLQEPITPLLCIPTTAGTGSEVTFFSVITDTETKLKMNILDTRLAPRIALLDPELTVTLPSHVTASTGMDALTHAIEAYTCNISEPITDALALYAIDQIVRYLPIAVADGTNLEARKQMLAASLIAGIAFGNSDVGGVHCMAEALGGLYDTPHGVANSMLLPFVFEYNIPADPEKHAVVAERLGAVRGDRSAEETAREGVRLLKKLAETVHIPKMKDLGNVNPDDFLYLAEAATQNVSAPSNPRPATKEDYLRLFRMAYEG
ncbi:MULTISPECIES: iron-containing alcohol dehydrogenase [Brevibacillus]|jgi:alcohol dehydrogenase|uniref:Alcohol dehydrogenase n=2 Tax=Brevibacillus borstelensis TaxID=45462 RepID=M8DAQ8_9BACL|nr:iron-containing alcohol dehydrogenase [Brevibacillus borstelensis]EMT53374.1 alcohol dehydrogenase [Brevibacillus borstelensis AK1]MBE5394232.1 iron-containing alcohol dehydrogenase [Brevibacillus borstelensis]MCC0564254.1 iron-containing alcohol dehydrogenase [Brevibacillus borstelensis]MCM3471569.1 iron-containing alcohol dehydrogenase [Brevibacillus borstelensis]MED1745444.1 iron-containing alcohol dehydrogenase [Brevibacillus borstelensis]